MKESSEPEKEEGLKNRVLETIKEELSSFDDSDFEDPADFKDSADFDAAQV